MEKKKIKLVTVTILERKLYDETEMALTFKISGGFLTIAKSQVFNFEKIVTWFPSWNGRYSARAFKFMIPLWLYEKNINKFNKLGEMVIIDNTHKGFKLH